MIAYLVDQLLAAFVVPLAASMELGSQNHRLEYCASVLQKAEVDGVEEGMMQQAQQFFLLSQTDNLWQEHLQVSSLFPLQYWRHLCSPPLTFNACIRSAPSLIPSGPKSLLT